MKKYYDLYKEFSKSTNLGSYSSTTYEIHINLEETDSFYYPSLNHEYTHFLQNFTTYNGFIDFYNNIGTMLRLFSHIGANQSEIHLPLKDCDFIYKSMGDRSLVNLLNSTHPGMQFDDDTEDYIFPETDSDDYEISEDEVFNIYEEKNEKIFFMALDGKRIPLNKVIVKENMANMVSAITYFHNSELDENQINEIVYQAPIEYTVIFDFIKNFLCDKNPIIITYKICEIALNILPLYETIGIIISYIKQEHERLNSLTENEILEEIKHKINYTENFKKQTENFKNLIDDQKKMFSALSQDNAFLPMISTFYDYINKGILKRKTKESFFELFDETFIEKYSKDLGTPIFFLNDSARPKLLFPIPKDFYESLIYIYISFDFIFTLWNTNSYVLCPFYDLCNNNIQNDLCLNSFMENFLDQKRPNCWLKDAMTICGINKDILLRK